MVLCDIGFYVTDSLAGLFILAILLTLVAFMALSGTLFYYLYTTPSYHKWQHKTIAKYPKPEVVAKEIAQTAWGVAIANIFPILSMWLSIHGYNKGYCGVSTSGVWWDVAQFFVIWIGSDLYEFVYHWMGHKFDEFWKVHKFHHQFHNPTPFAVIADCAMDNLGRSFPLLVWPFLMETNIDVMYLQFALLFYVYGVYLHCGYEIDWILSAHNPIVNTSYHHCAHHTLSTKNKPVYTGFFLKIWDQVAGSEVPMEKCICAICETKKGNRTLEKWKDVNIPDYNVLLTVDFWYNVLVTKMPVDKEQTKE